MTSPIVCVALGGNSGNSGIKSERKNRHTHFVNLYYIPAGKLAG